MVLQEGSYYLNPYSSYPIFPFSPFSNSIKYTTPLPEFPFPGYCPIFDTCNKELTKMVNHWPLHKCKKWLMPYNRHYPSFIEKSHEMSNNCINHTIWQSIFLLQKQLYEIAAIIITISIYYILSRKIKQFYWENLSNALFL